MGRAIFLRIFLSECDNIPLMTILRLKRVCREWYYEANAFEMLKVKHLRYYGELEWRHLGFSCIDLKDNHYQFVVSKRDPQEVIPEISALSTLAYIDKSGRIRARSIDEIILYVDVERTNPDVLARQQRRFANIITKTKIVSLGVKVDGAGFFKLVEVLQAVARDIVSAHGVEQEIEHTSEN